MKLNELIQNLHILNESELFYKKYYSIRNDPEQLALFLKTIDHEFKKTIWSFLITLIMILLTLKKKCFLSKIKARISWC